MQHKNPALSGKRPGDLICRQPSKTLQGGLLESNINHIVSRFLRTGELPSASARPALYGDLTIQPDLATALQMQLRAKDAWSALPLTVRKQVGEPAKLESWLKDPLNVATAVRFGLLKQPVQTSPKPVSAASPPPQAGSPPLSAPQGAGVPPKAP